jgi:acyl-CoA synthetase (AMP-forming)/AMP-acid ligase II
MLRLIADQAAINPEALALLAPDRLPLTYDRLYAEVYQHARLLRAIGINRKDRVALFLPNGPEAALSFLATSAVAICAPLNPAFATSEFDAVLSSLQPKALIANPNLSLEMRAVAEKRGIILVLRQPTKAARPAFQPFPFQQSRPTPTTYFRTRTILRSFCIPPERRHNQNWVSLTHGQLYRAAENIARSLQLTPQDRCLNNVTVPYTWNCGGDSFDAPCRSKRCLHLRSPRPAVLAVLGKSCRFICPLT